MSEIPMQVWVRNPAAWMIGGLAAWLLQRSDPRVLAGLMPAAVILLGAAFFGPEQSGIHRWVSLGPFSINAAMLVLPAAVVSLAAFRGKSLWPWLAALACLVVLAAQPDRSQALAFGVAVIWIALTRVQDRPGKFTAIAATALIVASAWFRPDSLEPVPEVEQIFDLAFAVSPTLAGAAAISLLASCLVPIWMTWRGAPAERAIGEALGLYFIVAAAMPTVGAYPVPLVGVGVSAVLGGWMAIGALSAARSIVEKDAPQGVESALAEKNFKPAMEKDVTALRPKI